MGKTLKSLSRPGTVPVGRVDGWPKVTGETLYVRDLKLPGMLYTAIVRSPYAHARITSVDVEQARGQEGVKAVLTGADIRYKLFGRSVKDIPVLAKDEVRFVGEHVAAVAATTQAQAEAAAALVEVHYEPLDPVLTCEDALSPEAPRVHDRPWAYVGAKVTQDQPVNLQSDVQMSDGDVEDELKGSAHVFEGTFKTATMHQGYLEPHISIARMQDGVVEIWSANKGPHRLRQQISDCVGVPEEKIWIHPVSIGGDFGGKGDPMETMLAIALAEATGHPVQVNMRYAEELLAGAPRHPSVTRVRLGVDGEGRFTALDVDVLMDGGAYGGYKPIPTVNLGGVSEAGGPYRLRASRVRSRIAYTHTVPRGHMRAPGSPQISFGVESLIDEAARALSLSPVEIRRRNVLKTGERAALGKDLVEARGPQTLEAALAAWGGPFSKDGAEKPPEPWALGLGCSLYRRDTHGGKTEVMMEPTVDGLAVLVGFGEQGAGQLTMVRNVVLQGLGVPPEAVQVRQLMPGNIGFDNGVGGSRTSVDAAEALWQACDQVSERLREEYGELKGPHEVVEALKDMARKHPGERFVAQVDHTHMPHVTSFSMHLVSVRVDRQTGQVVVDRVLTAADVANVINPVTHMIQLEGGVVQGFGQAVLEELPFEEGRPTAGNLGEYKMPSIRDIPKNEVVLVEGGRGVGRANIKAAGELTNVAVQAAIANAVADAVGVRIRQLPVTAERVYQALHGGESE